MQHAGVALDRFLKTALAVIRLGQCYARVAEHDFRIAAQERAGVRMLQGQLADERFAIGQAIQPQPLQTRLAPRQLGEPIASPL